MRAERKGKFFKPRKPKRGFASLIRLLKEWKEEELGVYVPIYGDSLDTNSKRKKPRTTGNTGGGFSLKSIGRV